MKILFIMSKKLQITSIVLALDRMGHEVGMYSTPIEDIGGYEEEEKELKEFLVNNGVDLVISNLCAPYVAWLTCQLEIKYAVYGMDSPMYEIYFSGIPHYDNTYLFFFDKKEYLLAKERGLANVYHLPLAADVEWAKRLVITDEEIKKYSCDMSFVGSLYSNNPYDQYITRFPQNAQQIFSDIMEQSAFVWDGRNRVGELLTPELAQFVKSVCPEVYRLDGRSYDLTDEYYLKEYFFARKLTHIERTLLMELLAERYNIHLYTKSDETVPDGIKRFSEVSQMTAGLKVFYSSKININITLRSIESGIPLRIFDIMSVGGFVLTNYQEEIPELFEEGKEIVTFKSPEELIDKADYYLSHDKARAKIGINGYKKVKSCYTYEHQLNKIISILFPTP